MLPEHPDGTETDITLNKRVIFSILVNKLINNLQTYDSRRETFLRQFQRIRRFIV